DPGREQNAGQRREDEIAELAGTRIVAVERRWWPEARTAIGIARDVGMRVDQAGHQGPASQIDRSRRWVPRGDPDRRNPSALDRDRRPLPGRPAEPVQQPRIPERDGHRAAAPEPGPALPR